MCQQTSLTDLFELTPYRAITFNVSNHDIERYDDALSKTHSFGHINYMYMDESAIYYFVSHPSTQFDTILQLPHDAYYEYLMLKHLDNTTIVHYFISQSCREITNV